MIHSNCLLFLRYLKTPTWCFHLTRGLGFGGNQTSRVTSRLTWGFLKKGTLNTAHGYTVLSRLPHRAPLYQPPSPEVAPSFRLIKIHLGKPISGIIYRRGVFEKVPQRNLQNWKPRGGRRVRLSSQKLSLCQQWPKLGRRLGGILLHCLYVISYNLAMSLLNDCSRRY